MYSRLVISAVVVAIKEYNDPSAAVTNDASLAIKMAEILKSAALRPYNQTIKTANHEHELTIGRLHPEAS